MFKFNLNRSEINVSQTYTSNRYILGIDLLLFNADNFGYCYTIFYV